MTDQEARDFLTGVFHTLFDPTARAEDVGAFFAENYQQIADGKTLDRAAFLDHVRVLKGIVEHGSVALVKVVASGSTVATMHITSARKSTGEDVKFLVHAFFEIENGLIQSTNELTHILHGSDEDRDLGSRTSH